MALEATTPPDPVTARGAEGPVRLMLDLMANAFADVDDAGWIREANPAACRLLGDSALVGRRLGEALPWLACRLAPPQGGAGGVGGLGDSEPGEPDESDDGEARHLNVRRPGGGWLQVRVLWHPGGLSLYLRDVTDQRGAALATRVLGLALEQSATGVVIADAASGAIEYANGCAAGWLGSGLDPIGTGSGESDPLCGSALSELLSLRLQGSGGAWPPALRETPTPRRFEVTPVLRPALSLSLNLHPVLDEAQQLTHWLLLIEDVSSAREQTLRRQELDAVFERADEGVLILDAQRLTLRQANPCFCALVGRSREALATLDAAQWMALLQPELHTPRSSGQPAGGSSGNDGAAEDSVTLREPSFSEGRVERLHRRPDGSSCIVAQRLTLVRGVDGEPLLWVCSWLDRTAGQQAANEIEFLRLYDPLTGLLNNQGLRERAALLIGWARAQGSRCGLASLDLANLHEINHHHGALAGDRLLCRMAVEIAALGGQRGVAARLGSGRFVVFAPLDEDTDALAWAHALRSRVRSRADGMSLQLGVGVAQYPDDALDLESLLAGSDLALASSKALPDAPPMRFSRLDLERARERLHMLDELRYALARQQLEVHYQPRVLGVGGRVVGVEALMRWRHPQWGWVSPVRFIPLAEEAGLIHELGLWVLERACEQVQRWSAAGPLALGVNLSSHQIAHPQLVEQVAAVLARTGLPPASLEFEITESVLLDASGHVDEVMQQIKALGVGLALDDFGTGYSSLAYLQRLPLDYLKIDRSFVQPLGSSQRQTAITEAIITIGHVLGLTLIAEGVETLEQRDWLVAHGCQQIQGFLFSRPLAAADLDTVMFTRRVLEPH